jgi:hypothetical protein
LSDYKPWPCTWFSQTVGTCVIFIPCSWRFKLTNFCITVYRIQCICVLKTGFLHLHITDSEPSVFYIKKSANLKSWTRRELAPIFITRINSLWAYPFYESTAWKMFCGFGPFRVYKSSNTCDIMLKKCTGILYYRCM